MSVKIVRESDVQAQSLPGRSLAWIIRPETVGAAHMSIAIMHCPAGSVVRPMHAHRGIEETLFIVSGQGEAWVDGERAEFHTKDLVFFPSDSRHQVRSVGPGELVTLSIFSSVTSPDSYASYAEDAFDADRR
jgi:mannose-6-phosphate isomerase-like protein (cupin superfamily)